MRSLEVVDVLHDAGVSITYRKLDYWIRLGLLSPRTENGAVVRGGYPRMFTPGDVELLFAIGTLYEMGADREHVAAAAGVMRGRRVSVAHPELLVMSSDLAIVARVTWRKMPAITRPCWVVPLRPFTSGV